MTGVSRTKCSLRSGQDERESRPQLPIHGCDVVADDIAKNEEELVPPG